MKDSGVSKQFQVVKLNLADLTESQIVKVIQTETEGKYRLNETKNSFKSLVIEYKTDLDKTQIEHSILKLSFDKVTFRKFRPKLQNNLVEMIYSALEAFQQIESSLMFFHRAQNRKINLSLIKISIQKIQQQNMKLRSDEKRLLLKFFQAYQYQSMLQKTLPDRSDDN